MSELPLGDRFLETCLRFIAARDEIAGVDLGEDLALPYDIAFLHVHAEQASDGVRADRDFSAGVGDHASLRGDPRVRRARDRGGRGRFGLALGLGLHHRAGEKCQAYARE